MAGAARCESNSCLLSPSRTSSRDHGATAYLRCVIFAATFYTRPSTFQFSDFLLDESGFELKRGETAIRVERRVFDLIVYLIKNRERAVTKEELVEQVWKQRCVGESVIARCVSTARKVVGDPEAIRNIYGRGYRWVAHVDEHVSWIWRTRK
jgi:DNA-binding winged helix-turn-helix (wHTH) protein